MVTVNADPVLVEFELLAGEISCPACLVGVLVEYLRRNMKLGPVMLVAELADFGITMHASTVHRILLRRGISRLADLDVTGEQMRVDKNKNRYEHPLAGDLVHIDVKKIGRIPDGGGWRVHGKGSIGHKASKRQPRVGYCYLHTAIDDHSRLAYTEALDDEKAVTAAAFWQRAKEFFAAHGIETIQPGAHRQRVLLPRWDFRRRVGRWDQAQLHPALPAADQRQG